MSLPLSALDVHPSPSATVIYSQGNSRSLTTALKPALKLLPGVHEIKARVRGLHVLMTHSPASSLWACPPAPCSLHSSGRSSFWGLLRPSLSHWGVCGSLCPEGNALPQFSCLPLAPPPSPATSAEAVGPRHAPPGAPFLPPQPGSPAIALFPSGPVAVCHRRSLASLIPISTSSPRLSAPRLQSPGCVIYH